QNATQTDWAAISILAHEIGHHLNGHTMMTKGGNPALELEADEFSGFVLRKMGASLVEAQKAMKLISDVIGSATHPKRSLRLTAIAKGYNSANSQLLAAVNQITPMQEIAVENEVIVAKADDVRLDKQHIFSEVHFNKMPGRKFFLTKKLNLVEVTEEGVEVLGDIVKSHNNQLELNIYDEDQTIKLNISPKGILYNQNQTVVGYLKSPVV
ncbi:MAG: membrane-binding protein, partial [Bacteroidota bacterium]|nr:membrane-binding protein [Bacteroidota bacterium]